MFSIREPITVRFTRSAVSKDPFAGKTCRNRTKPREGAALAESGASGCYPAPHVITIAPLGFAPANKDHAGAAKENPFRISAFKAGVPTL